MMIKNLLLTTIIILLSACGWQLRNSEVMPTDVGSLHLASNDAHSDLIQELTRALNLYGFKVAASSTDASYSVVITDFRQTRRTGTINAAARAAEYQLNEDVDFLIVGADGRQLIPPSTASVERVYEFDEQDILASDSEERLIRNSMREEIVRQILNRLRIMPSAGEQQ
tara:strand:+ start:11127 stop:11633 length:507 start_codon:yes stop_codon:yes gene_type:complete